MNKFLWDNKLAKPVADYLTPSNLQATCSRDKTPFPVNPGTKKFFFRGSRSLANRVARILQPSL